MASSSSHRIASLRISAVECLFHQQCSSFIISSSGTPTLRTAAGDTSVSSSSTPLLEKGNGSSQNFFIPRTSLTWLQSNIRDPHGIITQQKKLHLRHFLNQNDNQMPDRLQMRKLKTQLQLSSKQVLNQLYNIREPPGEITKDKKQSLLQWLQRHGNVSPTSKQRDKLQKHFQWNRSQLNQQIAHLRDVLSQDASQQKAQNGAESLSKKTGQESKLHAPILPESQLPEQVTSKEPKCPTKLKMFSSITKWHRIRMQSFLKNHPQRSYTAHDIRSLCRELALSRRQVYNLLRFYSEKKTPVTKAKQTFLETWFFQNGRRLPMGPSEWHHLQAETHLSKSQLYNQLRRLRDVKAPITEEKREIVREWMRQNEVKYPTHEERLALLEKTGLSPIQLQSMLQRCRQKSGS